MKFCIKIIYELKLLNFITDSNKYDKIIEEYKNELSEVYRKIQDLKEGNKWMSK